MVLGLILHTCAAFSSQQYWLVSYDKPLPWAYDLSSAIHVFRMPLFFMVSGFFAFVLLQKQSVRHFCLIKLTRIGWPLASVLLLINIPQFYILVYLSGLAEHSNVSPGNFAGHLWFLINLLVYFLTYACIHFLVARIKPPRAKFPSTIFMLLMLLIMPIVYLGMLALNQFGLPIYKALPIVGSIHSVFSYFDYFLIGVIFALLSHQKMMLVLKSSMGALVILPLLLIAAIPWWLPSAINNITLPYIEHIQAIAVSVLIWLLATRIFATESWWFRGLANASYSVYLFHHGIIVALVFGLNAVNHANNIVINPYLAFVMVLGLSFALTLVIHFFVVARSSKLRMIFNGK
ncbi:MAG: glucan biosynthesis protein C [Alphaproteobacteria bacterium]|jgi:glucan biosynthesis protein C